MTPLSYMIYMSILSYKTRVTKMIKKKNKFSKLENVRKELLRLILADDEIIEGSYCELLVKCGKVGCHCEKKPCHLVARLSIREDGKIKNKVVRVTDRENVKRLTERYREHKQALKELQEIHEMEQEILKELIKLKNKGYV